jgi:hypothetical protein
MLTAFQYVWLASANQRSYGTCKQHFCQYFFQNFVNSDDRQPRERYDHIENLPLTV